MANNNKKKGAYRITNFDDSIVYKLSKEKTVTISKNAWEVSENHLNLFAERPMELPQVEPIKSDNGLDRLDKYLNISEDEKLLLKVYLVCCFNPSIYLPTVNIKNPVRLADFHRFGYAVAEAMGGYGDTFNKALSKNKERQMEVVDENFEIVRILIDFLRENDGEWTSTVDMLYKSVRDFVILADEGVYDIKSVPKASNAFSRMLSLHEAHLAKRGFHFEIKKNGVGRHVITFHTDVMIRKPITGIRKPIILKDSTRELTSQFLDSLIADIEESEE